MLPEIPIDLAPLAVQCQHARGIPLTAKRRQSARLRLALGMTAAEARCTGSGDACRALAPFDALPCGVKIMIDIHTARICLPAVSHAGRGDKGRINACRSRTVHGNIHAVGIDARHDHRAAAVFLRETQRSRHGQVFHAVKAGGDQRTAARFSAQNCIDMPSAQAVPHYTDASFFAQTAHLLRLPHIIGINQAITLSEVF